MVDLTYFPEYFDFSDNKKIDSKATNGLAGTPDSLAYRVHEIEKHFHNSLQLYGLTTNTMARKSVSPIVVTAGGGAWGTELLIHNGTVIESGSTTKKFDLNQLLVTAVGTAGRVYILEFYKNTPGTAIASVVTNSTADTFTKSGHGLVNGDRVILSSIATTTNIDAFTVYHVVGVAGTAFQVSLTTGGAAVDLQTGNGTCTVTKVTQTLITETLVHKAATTSDVINQEIMWPRQSCDSLISCRAYGASGAGSNAISFFAGLHVYDA